MVRNPEFERTVLDNGITLLVERLPSLNTVSIGFWTDLGSREEPPEMEGAAHFIEHMIFKGTGRRSAADIAHEIESAGGGINAMTGRELTTCHARTLPEYLPVAVDILTDIVLNSTFEEDELTREKEVILEEIKDVLDTPEELVYDLFHEDCFGRAGIGHPVHGSEETVVGMSRAALLRLYRERYAPTSLIVAVAGNPGSHDPAELISGAVRGGPDAGHSAPRGTGGGKPAFGTGIRTHERKTEKVHLMMGVEGVPYHSDDRFVHGVLDAVLGGGMSSRLFQEVREKRGLVYDIGTENVHYGDTGIFGISASTRPANVPKLVAAVVSELARVKKGDVRPDELSRVKNQLRTSIAMSLESANSRMIKIGRSEIYYGRNVTDDEIMNSILMVTLDDLVRAACELFRPERFMTITLGPIPGGGAENLRADVADALHSL
ncbi:MAG: pitrilysin family protein [bacterium]